MTKEKRPELLAPAGGTEAALAAFHFGADAIYLGLRRFSARAEAENFDGEALDAITAFAHAQPHPRKVYVAINTLVQERELREVAKALALVRDCAADGVILQDLAVARLAKRYFPSLELHASTQMAIHSRAGVEQLAREGFSRVVLSRELTLDEIANAARVEGMEIEIFLHGALCYALSGQCMFSSMLYGKSGNRGACTYPCRDLWTIRGGSFDHTLKIGDCGHCFSMKDLALDGLINDLINAGVTSLKIEGRKKSPLYVAATTNYYRHLLDNDRDLNACKERAAAIRTIFSRPWTELFLRGHRNTATIDTNFVGHRGEAIGNIQSVVQKPEQGATAIRFTTLRQLEKHDGLQIEVPGLDRPFGFGVNGMRLIKIGGDKFKKNFSTVSVPAFSQVEVDLPPGAPRLELGMEVRLSSSNQIKRALSFTPPNLSQFKRRHPLALRAILQEDSLIVEANVLRDDGTILVAESAKISGPFQRAKDSTKTKDGMASAFGKLGDTKFALAKFELEDAQGLFVPISRLNELRRTLALRLEAKLQAMSIQEAAQVATDVDQGFKSASPVSDAIVLTQLSPSPSADFSSATASNAKFTTIDALPADVPLPTFQNMTSPVAFAHPTTPSIVSTKFREPQWILRVDDLALLDAFEGNDWISADEYLVDIPRENDALRRWHVFAAAHEGVKIDKIRWSVPAFLRDTESKALKDNLKQLFHGGFRKFQVGNPSALIHLKNVGIFPGATVENANADKTLSIDGGILDKNSPVDLTSDWQFHTMNSQAALALTELGLTRLTLSPEDNIANWKALPKELLKKSTVILWQDTPLFIAESCPHAAFLGRCPGPSRCTFKDFQLEGSRGDKIHIFTRACRTFAISESPLNLTREMKSIAALGIGWLRADFALRPYSAEHVKNAWLAIRKGMPLKGGQSANFHRGFCTKSS